MLPNLKISKPELILFSGTRNPTPTANRPLKLPFLGAAWKEELQKIKSKTKRRQFQPSQLVSLEEIKCFKRRCSGGRPQTSHRNQHHESDISKPPIFWNISCSQIPDPSRPRPLRAPALRPSRAGWMTWVGGGAAAQVRGHPVTGGAGARSPFAAAGAAAGAARRGRGGAGGGRAARGEGAAAGARAGAGPALLRSGRRLTRAAVGA